MGAIFGVEFFDYACDVEFNGEFGDMEKVADFFVGKTFDEKYQNSFFSLGKFYVLKIFQQVVIFFVQNHKSPLFCLLWL